MDLSQAITLERPGQSALDLNSVRDPLQVGSSPLSGYNVESVDFSDVNITAFAEDTPQVDGIDAYDPYLGARQITMIVGVYGSTYGDFWDKITELNYALQAQPKYATGTAFPADGFRKLSFTQPKVGGSYSLYMKVRPVALPRFVTDASSSAGDDIRGYAVSVRVTLVCEDPYKYFQTPRVFTITGSGSLTVINDGKTAAWPTVEWSNTSTVSPLRTELGTDGVTFTKAGGFGSTFSVDFKRCTSTQINYITEYEFFQIPPGTSTVTVTSGAGVVCTLTINEAIL